MAPGVLGAELAFSRGAQKSGQAGLVHNGNNHASAEYELQSGDPLDLDLEALRWWYDAVDRNVVEPRLGG